MFATVCLVMFFLSKASQSLQPHLGGNQKECYHIGAQVFQEQRPRRPLFIKRTLTPGCQPQELEEKRRLLLPLPQWCQQNRWPERGGPQSGALQMPRMDCIFCSLRPSGSKGQRVRAQQLPVPRCGVGIWLRKSRSLRSPL
jgi:hypothetical protein